MGYLKTHPSASSAPYYSSNTLVTPDWSGVADTDFTSDLEWQLKRFILHEAKRQGFNDSAQNRIGENRTFFHFNFLSGWPHKLWIETYREGIKDQVLG